MIKQIVIVLFSIVMLSCTSRDELIIEKIKIGEKHFEFSYSYLGTSINVDKNTNYYISGICPIASNHLWSGYILKTNDSLQKDFLIFPDNLNFNGHLPGGYIKTSIVENDNLLFYGVLNNYEYFIAKFTNTGEELWYKRLDDQYANLFINDLVRLDNYYFFIGYRIINPNLGGVSPSYTTEFGKMSLDGNIIFSKQYSTFSNPKKIEIFDSNSLLISSVQFWHDSNQILTNVLAFNKVIPCIIKINLEGDIIWQSKISEIETSLFSPSNFYFKKGNNYIYSVFNVYSSNAFNAKIAKTDFSGNVKWVKPLDGIEVFKRYKRFSTISDFDIDYDENIYIIGYSSDDIDWGPWYFGLAKFSSNGSYIKATKNPNLENELMGYGLKIDKENNIVTVSHGLNLNSITLIKYNRELESL